MKILVTGGNGFIGGNFIRHVLDRTDMEVVNLDLLTYAGTVPHSDSPRYTFHQSDIGDTHSVLSVLNTLRPQYIINFAAETHVDRSIQFPDAFVHTNVNGTYGLLRALMQYTGDFKFLHVSTDEVFGQLQPNDPPFTEQTAYAPNSPYSATKAASDHLVRAFHHTYKLPAIITNCSNNYGPYQFPEKFIPVVILKAYLNRPIPIYGTGTNVRDWLYVEDHCEALLHTLLHGQNGESYNIGGETELPNNEVVRIILSVMDKPSSLIQYVEDRKGHDFRYAMDISHIRNSLGWSPKVSFDTGITRTVEWYVNNIDWIKTCVNLESF